MQTEMPDSGPDSAREAQPAPSPAPAVAASAPQPSPAPTKPCVQCGNPIPAGATKCLHEGCGAYQYRFVQWFTVGKASGIAAAILAAGAAVFFAFGVDTKEKGWALGWMKSPELVADVRLDQDLLTLTASNPGGEDGSLQFVKLTVSNATATRGHDFQGREIGWEQPDDFTGKATLPGSGESTEFAAHPTNPVTELPDGVFFSMNEENCRYRVTVTFAGEQRTIPANDEGCACGQSCALR
jgi:hypothetical protein